MKKELTYLLSQIKISKILGNSEILIEKIEIDSRKVNKNCLFAAISGTQVDGHTFIDSAIKNGAAAILCEKLPANISEKVTFILVKKVSESLGKIATAFYDFPSKKLKLVGVTGTNGKTTTATLLYRMFLKLDYKVGCLSTVKYYVNEQEFPATHTTPDAISLNFWLNEMVKQNCEFAFMEVSSHSVVQHRISGLTFAGGIFSNITHDHLDYHKTFAEYIKAKKTFFDNLPEFAFALINSDDKNGKIMLQNTKAKKFEYSLKSISDFKAKILEKHFDGMLLVLDNVEVWTHLIGTFNAYNLLAIYSAAILLGQEKNEVLRIISELQPVAGRFETVHFADITAIVDYAHTPDALQNVLQTINEMRNQETKLITLVGAGGDRDRTKRPIMAKISAENSDILILTSDNPRTEKPEEIIEEMFQGLDNQDVKKTFKITDRREAIKMACHLARKNDVILIAGKGHENYQEINGVKFPFDDKEIVEKELKN